MNNIMDNNNLNQSNRRYNSLLYWLLIVIVSLQFYNYPFLEVGSSLFVKLLLRFLLFTYSCFYLYYSQGFNIIINLRSASVQCFIFYQFIAFVSTFYSVMPVSSIIRSLDLSLLTASALAISSTFDRKKMLVSYTFSQIAIYLILFFVQSLIFGEPIWRPMGEALPRLGGFTINPNVLAYTILLLLSSALYIRSRIYLIVPVLILLLALCFSRTSFVTLTLIILFRLVRLKKAVLKTIILITFISICGLLYSYNSDLFSYILTRGHDSSNFSTLGGRTDIWNLLVDNLPNSWNILWGYGFQMLSSDGLVAQLEGSQIYATMAHNNLLQSLTGLGLIGLVTNILFWIFIFADLIKYSYFQKDFFEFIESIYFASFCFSMIEFGIFTQSTMISWIFFVVFLTTISRTIDSH